MTLIQDLPVLPRRAATGHKGNYGTVLGIGGSRGMAGAVALAGRAALLAGAGLARLAVPDPVLETVAGFFPEPTTIPCPADAKGRFSAEALEALLEWADSASVVFLGPGLGRSEDLNHLVYRFLRQLDRPAVVDADALNALASFGENLEIPASTDSRPLVLTPHPGEFSRLRGRPTPTEDRRDQRIEAAEEFARKHEIILVLKGHETITTDGKRTTINTTGNPGMATGGSGDVLTGVISGLLAQNLEPFDAARLGVYLHGAAGDLAAEKYGEVSIIASTILEHLPGAFLAYKQYEP